jgi:hypothetical protein
MLSFGEIDIRTQIIKRAILSNVSLSDQLTALAGRLVHFSQLVYEKFEVPVLIWEPIASASDGIGSGHALYPAVGSEYERNYCTKEFSKLLRALCGDLKERGVSVFSFGIYDHLAIKFSTNVKFFRDGYHLNLYGLNLAIDELRRVCDECGIPGYEFYKYYVPYLNPAKNRQYVLDNNVNLIRFDHWKWSSDSISEDFEISDEYIIKTKNESSSSIVIELDYSVAIKRIKIRLGGDEEDRFSKFSVRTGHSKKNLILENTLKGNYSKDGKIFIIEANAVITPKFIYLTFVGQKQLIIEDISVHAFSFLRERVVK